MESPRPSSSRMRWLIVFMAFLATAINYVDRANLSVAVPYLQSELGLSAAASGALLGAFFWTYAGFQLPSGWFVDKVGARVAYAGAVVWWSTFTALMALGNSFASLFGLRLMLGVGEAPAYPCNAKVVSEWFPRSERALASAIFDSGARVGTAISLPLVASIIGAFGWRASFVITGALGFVWTLVWVRLYRRPREHAGVSHAELAYIEAGQEPRVPIATAEQPQLRWRDLFRYRTMWGMMLGFFCLNFVVYFFITWFPTYLVKERGFTLLKLGIFGTLPALVAILGGWAGGLVSDALVRRGKSLTAARKIPIVSGMIVSSCIALAVVVPNAAWALALLALSYGSLTFAGASVWSLPGDVAPTPQHVGSISGIQNFASNLAGVCISTFVGVMLGRSGGFLIPLLVAGGFSLLGAFSYLFIVGEIAPLPPLPSARAANVSAKTAA
jgi:ACS family D-galactonate transporter-like MFS transporter